MVNGAGANGARPDPATGTPTTNPARNAGHPEETAVKTILLASLAACALAVAAPNYTPTKEAAGMLAEYGDAQGGNPRVAEYGDAQGSNPRMAAYGDWVAHRGTA
jgi:hypothetical protein